ncbi:uncharacterized protein OCT59_009629 [Rhizophagus irregularis]|uniref:uncharacterized protein n=1 Tax=Rhizophagus irregularis TaxID=588596 RepID=UPI0033220B2C|nr:hypothetical protein OCT59_009629 [Rhizophagus irregularis]
MSICRLKEGIKVIIILSTICLKRVKISCVTLLNDKLDEEELTVERSLTTSSMFLILSRIPCASMLINAIAAV